jgi:hypothetical protein
MSDKPEVNSKKQIDLGIVLDDREDVNVHVIDFSAFEAQALELAEVKAELSNRSAASYFMRNVELSVKIESLEQELETTKKCHIEALDLAKRKSNELSKSNISRVELAVKLNLAKDENLSLKSEITQLEQANAKLEREINRLNQKYDFQLLVKSNEELKRQVEEARKDLEQQLELQKVGCAAFKKFADDLEQENKKLEEMRSLDQNAIEAKDHKIVLLEKENREMKDFKKATESLYKRYEQANAKLEAEKDQLFDTWQKNDWNLRQENAKLKAEIDSLKLQQLVKTEE